MGASNVSNRVDTTLGELIEAVSEVAFEYSDNAQEAYTMARLALVEILKNSAVLADTNRVLRDPLHKKTYLN